MKKWMNTIFFGSCFIVAIILETYGMVVWDGNLFSVIALGVVVLITGYLFMDAIRSRLKQGSEDAKFYFDKVLGEESEKRTERHTEIVNLQKASYTATKKNAVLLTEQFTEVLTRLEALEENNSRMLQRIIELQRTSLEGQKNALNLEISYAKENTRKIIEALKEDNSDQNLSNQLSGVLLAMKENNRLLGEHMLQEERTGEHFRTNEMNAETYDTNLGTSWQPSISGFTEDTGFEETAEIPEENAPETDWSLQDEAEPEADNSVDSVEDEEKIVIPLYDDPNKALTADEIAKLFASFGN